MARKITLPLTEELAKTLHAGDQLLLTGTIYTSRDAGHKRMCEALAKGEDIPFDPKDATIYYVGPTPAKPGQVIGSAGPTTSGRMDAYAPTMMSVGARGMIGKGARLPEVVEAMKKYSGVYFGAIGGAGALLAKCIKKAELIAYEDLGAEALRKLYVEDMPVVVIIDSEGNNLYEEGRIHDLLMACIRIAKANIILNGIIEKVDALKDHADILHKAISSVIFYILPVHKNLTFLNIPKAGNQVAKGCFT